MATPRKDSEGDDEDVGIQKLVAIAGASLDELGTSTGTSKRSSALTGKIIDKHYLILTHIL